MEAVVLTFVHPALQQVSGCAVIHLLNPVTGNTITLTKPAFKLPLSPT